MKRSTIVVAGIAALVPAAAAAQTGMYPYTRDVYQRGVLVSSTTQRDVVIERYRGTFRTKNAGTWVGETLSIWARNTGTTDKCVMVRFEAVGTSLDWASDWGNGQVFLVKKGKALPNFAGLTAYEPIFGFRNLSYSVWEPEAKNKCGSVPDL